VAIFELLKIKTKIMNKAVYWTPRILTIVFIIFISLFALDSFDGNLSFMEKIKGFLIHLIPSAFVVVILYFSWEHEIFGAVAFLLLAIGYSIMVWGKFPLATCFIISGPMIIISLLFFMGSRTKQKTQ